jgi:hypothetical protein
MFPKISTTLKINLVLTRKLNPFLLFGSVLTNYSGVCT